MPPLPAASIQVLAPFAPLFSKRVWGHAQVLLGGAILAPGARTVTTALRAMGLAAERRFTNSHRVLNRATWSARHGSRMLLGVLITLLVPPGATIVLGADDTVERRSGRKIAAKGCDRDKVGFAIACHPLFRPERGLDDAPGPRALESAGVGSALSPRVVLAGGDASATPAQDQH